MKLIFANSFVVQLLHKRDRRGGALTNLPFSFFKLQKRDGSSGKSIENFERVSKPSSRYFEEVREKKGPGENFAQSQRSNSQNLTVQDQWLLEHTNRINEDKLISYYSRVFQFYYAMSRFTLLKSLQRFGALNLTAWTNLSMKYLVHYYLCVLCILRSAQIGLVPWKESVWPL